MRRRGQPVMISITTACQDLACFVRAHERENRANRLLQAAAEFEAQSSRTQSTLSQVQRDGSLVPIYYSARELTTVQFLGVPTPSYRNHQQKAKRAGSWLYCFDGGPGKVIVARPAPEKDCKLSTRGDECQSQREEQIHYSMQRALITPGQSVFLCVGHSYRTILGLLAAKRHNFKLGAVGITSVNPRLRDCLNCGLRDLPSGVTPSSDYTGREVYNTVFAGEGIDRICMWCGGATKARYEDLDVWPRATDTNEDIISMTGLDVLYHYRVDRFTTVFQLNEAL